MKHIERYYLLFPQNALQMLNVDIICNCHKIHYSYSLILFVYWKIKELILLSSRSRREYFIISTRISKSTLKRLSFVILTILDQIQQRSFQNFCQDLKINIEMYVIYYFDNDGLEKTVSVFPYLILCYWFKIYLFHCFHIN